MSRYKLVIDNPQNFFSAFEDANLNFNGCTLKDVIVEPEKNLWQIKIITDKNFDEKIFAKAEDFLFKQYGAHVEFKREVLNDFIPTPPKNSSAKKSNGKKISGEVTKIIDITKEDEGVVIQGEVSADEKLGVNLREFKNGTIAVTFCIIDDTNGIFCKKFFKGDKKADAKPFADSLKAGNIYKISGVTRYDDYLKEITVFINAVEPVETAAAREDTAEVKRVELHVHTQMSAMDAIIPVDTLIKTAAAWNWNAVARCRKTR